MILNLWDFMNEDDEIIIQKEYEINCRFSATFYEKGKDTKKGKGMTAQEALSNLIKLLEVEK